MIIETLPNTNPYTYVSGNACKILGPSLPEPVTPVLPGFCICDFIRCEYAETVFAEPTSTDWWKNDMNDFLFKRLVPADTVVMELHKDDEKVADLNNNALGTFFNGFPAGSAEQQLYVGYLLDWKLVQAAHGFGNYQVKATLNIIGNVTNFESRKFHLLIFTPISANQTVRIETTQNGNIIGSQFDYTGLNWYGSVRVPGIFGNPKPLFEASRYVTESRNRRQIQDKQGREWSLNTKLLPWEVSESLIYDRLLGNEILMTDYYLINETVFRRQSVLPSEFEKPDISGNPNKIFNIKFVDAKDIFIKRNF